MAQFGELALILGDLHIPYRVNEVPQKIKEILQPNKVQHVLCTGNLCNQQTLDWVKSMAPKSCHVVRGDFDDDTFPEEKILNIGKYKIGLIHGHQIIPWGNQTVLYNTAKDMGVDILITGCTHSANFKVIKEVSIINPGSITGALSDCQGASLPCFSLLEIRESGLSVHLYTLQEGQLTYNQYDVN